MGTKVDPSSSPAEPRRGQTIVPAAAPASSPKVSKFGAKSGFVIPKNKLSGSLVPIFRGGGKVETGDAALNDASVNQVQRKTKWGADLTLDAAVRKGRALAYQTRVEQITNQLKSRTLEFGDDQGSRSPKQALDVEYATNQKDYEKNKLQSRNIEFELLELEKQEVIGEILRLNPSYKAPSDYKPLLKVAKIPIPVNACPVYHFIGLLLGTEGNTQKRIEEDTGAKIRVHGTKADSREKLEITQQDVAEALGAFEELYVSISAETYEKVDAAVALIELFLMQVSGKSAVASTTSTSSLVENVNTFDPSKNGTASNYSMTAIGDVNQGVPQPMAVPAQSGPPQYQLYRGPWIPGVPSNNPVQAPPVFMPPSHMPNNNIQFRPLFVSSFAMPSYPGRPPPMGPVPRTSSAVVSRPQLPNQVLQQTPNQAISSPSQPAPGQQLPPTHSMPTQPSSTGPPFFPASQLIVTGTMQSPRPPAPVNPHLGSIASEGPLPNRNMMAPSAGNPSGWSTTMTVGPPPQRQNTMTQMAIPAFPTTINPYPAIASSTIASVTSQLNMPSNVTGRPQPANFGPPATFSSFPAAPPAFSSVPQTGLVSPQIMASSSIAPLQRPMPQPTLRPPRMPVHSQGLLGTATPGPMSGSSHPPQMPVHANAPGPLSAQALASLQSLTPGMARPSTSNPTPTPGQLQRPGQLAPFPQHSVISGTNSGGMPTFSPLRPAASSSITPVPISVPKPHPSASNFTFQHVRGPVSASPTASVANSSNVLLAAPQAPSFQPALQNMAPQVGAQGFPRPPGPSQIPNQLSPATVSPSNGLVINQMPPRAPIFRSPSPISLASAAQIGPQSFSSAPLVPNLPAAPPTQPTNMLLSHQNLPAPVSRPSNFATPNQQPITNPPNLGGKVASSPSGSQIYDPFSPTSALSTSQQGDTPMQVMKQETDAEYEDLMASVGVR